MEKGRQPVFWVAESTMELEQQPAVRRWSITRPRNFYSITSSSSSKMNFAMTSHADGQWTCRPITLLLYVCVGRLLVACFLHTLTVNCPFLLASSSCFKNWYCDCVSCLWRKHYVCTAIPVRRIGQQLTLFLFLWRTRRYKTEYKKKFRPFSLYQYVDGKFQKSSSDKIPTSSSAVDGPARQQQPGDKMDKDTWYGEVLELRKKAGEYKVRPKFSIPAAAQLFHE